MGIVTKIILKRQGWLAKVLFDGVTCTICWKNSKRSKTSNMKIVVYDGPCDKCDKEWYTAITGLKHKIQKEASKNSAYAKSVRYLENNFGWVGEIIQIISDSFLVIFFILLYYESYVA